MRTSVKLCRCPCSFLYCFLRLKWKTRILSPRPSPSTFAVDGLATLPASPLTASTSANSTVWFSAATFSIFTTSPGATRYCLPPVRITAYITNPPALRLKPRRNLLESLFLRWGGYRSLHRNAGRTFTRLNPAPLQEKERIAKLYDFIVNPGLGSMELSELPAPQADHRNQRRKGNPETKPGPGELHDRHRPDCLRTRLVEQVD